MFYNLWVHLETVIHIWKYFILYSNAFFSFQLSGSPQIAANMALIHTVLLVVLVILSLSVIQSMADPCTDACWEGCPPEDQGGIPCYIECIISSCHSSAWGDGLYMEYTS